MAKGICSVDSCERPIWAKGWCSGHLSRWYKGGDVRADVPLIQRRRLPRGTSAVDRAEFFTDRNGPTMSGMDTPCWLWTSGHYPAGYGAFWLEGRTVLVHRWWYEQLIGPIPEGLELDHLCINRGCCNPAHLEPVTHAENLLRSPTAPATINARKTHCIHGHAYDEANTRITSKGQRQCRACRRRRYRLTGT